MDNTEKNRQITENPNQYGFFDGMSNPYKEYIENHKYLEEIEAKIPLSVTTLDVVESTGDAFHAWDIELNKIYSLLIQKLPSEKGESLRAEQRLWIKERDQSANHVAELGVSYSNVDYNDVLFSLTKQRTLELVYIYFGHNSDKNLAMEAYRKVLRNEAKFFSTDDNKDVLLKEHKFFSNADLSKLNFTVVDMDGDGIPEVVLEWRGYGVEVLHYEDGTVYDYSFGWRSMNGGIKKDGSYQYVDGPEYGGYEKMQFLGITYKLISLASYEDKFEKDGVFLETVLLVNNEPATEAESKAFNEEWSQKDDVIWYELNEDNIALQITIE